MLIYQCHVEKGKIVGLIGPNGSGKTTLFNSIVGTYPVDSGSIKFNNKEVSELPVPVIAKLRSYLEHFSKQEFMEN
jgi:branched-chain amino acid transport system ATP-binding protein